MSVPASRTAPTISVVMISFRDEAIIEDCLRSIRGQDYPQDRIEILLVDGGSPDRTAQIGRAHGAQVIERPDLRAFPNVRAGIALTSGSGDLLLFMSADNRLQEPDVLSRMVEALVDPSIIACETWRYGYAKTDPALSRYFALIGGGDPIAVGLGKADRGPFDATRWHGHGEVQDCGTFFRVAFAPDVARIPTLGANGFLIKRAFLQKTTLASSALHIDMCVELILAGHNAFAFLKDRHVVHYIDVPFLQFLRRRLLYAKMYDSDSTSRIYHVFDRRDTARLAALVLANLTLVVPAIRALRGYLQHRDSAWFLHPIVSFAFTLGYGLSVLRKGLAGRPRD